MTLDESIMVFYTSKSMSNSRRSSMDLSHVDIKNVLTRTTGFLKTVTSHSLQPYRGCSYGNSLCGVGCYVQHNHWVTRGRAWGGFLEVRRNTAAAYLDHVEAERRWARKNCDRFGLFMSSSTDPCVPQESKYGVSRSVLEAMVTSPPDLLILQTHSHRVTDYADLLQALNELCDLCVHVSIETDIESFPGLPPHASPVAKRFHAVEALRDAWLHTAVTVSPLLPIRDPESFFERIGCCVSAVLIDHYIEGVGSQEGRRTLQTPLPDAIRSVNAEAVTLECRDQMVEVAERWMPGRVGVNIDGFAGRFRSS